MKIEREEKLQLIEAIINEDSLVELGEEERATARVLFDRLFPEPEVDLKSFLSTAWLEAIRRHRKETGAGFNTANQYVQKLFASFNSHNKSDR